MKFKLHTTIGSFVNIFPIKLLNDREHWNNIYFMKGAYNILDDAVHINLPVIWTMDNEYIQAINHEVLHSVIYDILGYHNEWAIEKLT